MGKLLVLSVPDEARFAERCRARAVRRRAQLNRRGGMLGDLSGKYGSGSWPSFVPSHLRLWVG
jgi:hypothetical protein